MKRETTIKEKIQRDLDMPKPVRIRRIQEVSDGDLSVERELINIFLSVSEEQVEEMEAALHDKNLEILKKRTHSIKGSSGTFGADGMREIALRIEEDLATRRLSHVAEALDQLKHEFFHVRTFLEDYLNERASS